MCDCCFLADVFYCFVLSLMHSWYGGGVVLPTNVPTEGWAGHNNGSDINRPVGAAGGVAGVRW